MPRLPQETDFGARLSLRSGRLDMPGQDDLATGQALENAANTFIRIVNEKQAKRDRLNYALAKNELLRADIENREKLRDDDDYDTYDARYAEGFNTARDDIYERFKLDRDDAAILQAESDLIRERGRVQVANQASKVKRDQGQARLEQNLVDAREQILSLDPQSANDLMHTQLDAIQAAVDDNIYTESEGLGLSQKFVQDTALGRLESMPVEDRVEALEKSLNKRKAAGAISPEDIRKGKGTGSIADFVNRDTAQKMLDVSRETLEADTALEEAQTALDKAWDLHPEPEDWKERDKIIRQMTTGKARKEAEIQHRARTASATADEEAGKDEQFELWSDRIFSGEVAYHEIPGDQRTYMGAARTEKLLRLAESIQQRDGFGEYDDYETEYKWRTMSDQDRSEAALNSAEWRPFLTRQTWSRFLAEQEAIKSAMESPGKDPNIYRGDPDDEVLRGMLTGGPNAIWDEIPTKGSKDYQKYIYLDSEVNKALVNESLQRYRDRGTGYLAPQDVQEITARVIGRVVYVDDWGKNTRTLSSLLDPDETDDIYVDIDTIRAEPAPADSMGRAQTMEDYLRNVAGKDVSDRTIERAYYHWAVEKDVAKAMEVLTE